MAGKSAPSANDSYKLAEDFGVGPGAMAAGQLVTVSGVYEPGTPGLGESTEDIVVADFLDLDNSHRTLALPLSEFTALFQKVK